MSLIISLSKTWINNFITKDKINNFVAKDLVTYYITFKFMIKKL